MRKIPENILVPELNDPLANSSITLTYELVTPMYGGGTIAGQPDEAMPVRASAIRGQLRFWWRVVTRNQFSNYEEQRQAEFALWGGPDKDSPKASQIRVRVKDCRNVNYLSWQELVHRKIGKNSRNSINLRYVLFPLAENKNKKSLIEPGLRFNLIIEFLFNCECQKKNLQEDLCKCKKKNLQEDFRKALRAWTQFGGIGARTRRGLGAVSLIKCDDPSITDLIEQPITANEVAEQGCTLVLQHKTETDDANVAWLEGIDKLYTFRQGVGMGGNLGNQPDLPRRSRWPELDSIRHFKHKADSNHAPVHPALPAFPRAAFGLPINFHFQSKSDRSDASLNPVIYGERKERMASPLILRPFKTAEGQWVAAALLLPHSHIAALKLDLSGTAVPYWNEQKAALVTPMSEYGLEPLSAFLKYFAS